ncbi:uncharacterized protein LOC104434405 [Eucalyptus grandis]|uniref:uncharacterized protein LOC104434405 n=1 Tax=Eucalyptus grandis TaxID=71139 RepID=UPI00192ECF5F|nr:uncharacterized protein LOC104434405 [Eucalyptus grandis]
MLAQKRSADGKECAIYYLSKKFSTTEMNYSNVEKTCAALVWVLHKLWQYTLHYHTFLVCENDPITYLLEQPTLVRKLTKWQILISKFDVQSVPQKLVKGQVIVDMLANSTMRMQDEDKYDSLDDRILTMEKELWTMFFNGATNLSGCGTGAILISLNGQHYPIAAKLVFTCTNNITEYEACILGLRAAIEMETVGKWRTRDAKLVPYSDYLEDLVKEFDKISFEYLSRSHNQFADALATLSSMLKVTEGLEIEPLKMEVLAKPAYCMVVTEEPDEKPWYYDIMTYIQKQEFS